MITRQKKEVGVSVLRWYNGRKTSGFEEGRGHEALEEGGSQCYADF